MKTRDKSCEIRQVIWSQVLKFFPFFCPQILQFLLRTPLKLRPRDGPPWLQFTLQNFKDHWAIVSVAGWLSAAFTGWLACMHISFLDHQEAPGQGGTRASTTAAPRVTWSNPPSGTHRRGPEAPGLTSSFASCRTLAGCPVP